MNAEDDESVDESRRHFLIIATTTVGLVGAGATAVPFLESWRPSARALALGAPVDADVSKLEPGAMMRVEWRGQPIYIVHRTAAMLATLGQHNASLRDPNSNNTDQQPAYAKNEFRSIEPEYLVVVGICTHLGCAPVSRFQPGDPELGATWPGGFYCPCHGSTYDLSGRVFKDVPAPSNLKVPPYRFLSDEKLLIGTNPAT